MELGRTGRCCVRGSSERGSTQSGSPVCRRRARRAGVGGGARSGCGRASGPAVSGAGLLRPAPRGSLSCPHPLNVNAHGTPPTAPWLPAEQMGHHAGRTARLCAGARATWGLLNPSDSTTPARGPPKQPWARFLRGGHKTLVLCVGPFPRVSRSVCEPPPAPVADVWATVSGAAAEASMSRCC